MPINLPKASRRAELNYFRDYTLAREWQRGEAFGFPCFGIIGKRSKLTDRLSAFVEGIEMRLTERPAAVWYPLPCFEVNPVKRRTPAGPVVGRAAKNTQARRNEREIGKPNIFALRK